MKYVDEFRDGELARGIADAIAREVQPGRDYRFMEFCGGHTHAIFRYGLPDLLPPNVQMVHGPGCPVCVLPVGRIDTAVELVRKPGVTLCTYGDLLRVPGSDRTSLLRAKAEGADVRMVYSPADALRIAQENPDREVIFFAIGFETTTPPTAVALKQAQAAGLENFSIVCNHVLTPAAIGSIVDAPVENQVLLDGFVGPAHVSCIIGSGPYEPFAEQYRQPVVIAGFEPLDLLEAIRRLVRQVNDGRAEVENEYTRAVTREGNRKAQALTAEMFEVREAFEWRGLGMLPDSGLRIRPEYAHFDAEVRFGLEFMTGREHPGCACGEILRGAKGPRDCKLFATVCTPENPLGSCMVSSEGACAAYYTYGRHTETA